MSLRYSLLYFLIIGMLTAIILLHSSSFASYVWSNLGWRQFAQDVVFNSRTNVPAIHYFLNSISVDPTNQRAYLGGGMVSARVFDESQALTLWRQGSIRPGLLNQLGQQVNGQGLTDLAFIYHRSAIELAPVESVEGSLKAGRICQLNYTDLSMLSDVNQQYCLAYFANVANNLIVDGQFDGEIDWGWSGLFSFVNSNQSKVERDYTLGTPAPSLQLSGLTPGRHPAVYQRIPLKPGTTVRFSGRFRAEAAGDIEGWLLYIGWRQDNKSQGTYSKSINSDLDWTYLEQEFILPVGSEPWVQIYPVLLNGQGTVWSDGIKLEMVNE